MNINDILNQEPRPSFSWSNERNINEIEIPKSEKNEIQTTNANGRSLDVDGIILNESDKDDIINEINSPSTQTIDVPELDTTITAIPVSYSISDRGGEESGTYEFSLTLEETS